MIEAERKRALTQTIKTARRHQRNDMISQNLDAQKTENIEVMKVRKASAEAGEETRLRSDQESREEAERLELTNDDQDQSSCKRWHDLLSLGVGKHIHAKNLKGKL